MSVSRRTFLRGASLGGAALVSPAILAACGDDDDAPASTPTSAGGDSSPTSPPTAGASPTAAVRGPSAGVLNVAEPFLPASLDADTGSSSFNLQFLGALECLMRFDRELKPQPWIAEGIERTSPTTWVVRLRDDVTFWDGTLVDAEAVKASLTRSIEMQPGTADQIPPGSEITANGQELTIETPVPIGLMPYNLANPAFSIKKVGPGDTFIYTGPYRVEEFTAREFVNLTAYEGYRGGPAWIKEIRARQVADTSARSLALQSGDVQIAQALLPSDVDLLKSAGLQVFTSPWARQHMVILNVNEPPFDDPAVRKAFALAVDRDALVDAIMEGAASPGTGIAPEDIGHKGIVATQRFDLEEAMQVLDAAGWALGNSGIREKDGKSLSFKLGTYAGRAELEQSAVAIIDMLRAAGMEATIEQSADIEKTIADNAFQAATYSIGSAAFGDLSRLLATLYIPSSRNKDRYSNPAVNEAFSRYIQTSDPDEQADLLTEMQELIGEDVPIVHLFNPQQVVGASDKVKNFAPHPLDSYKYGPDMTLEG